jgi:predicted MPP superfamily phosphohydrolase
MRLLFLLIPLTLLAYVLWHVWILLPFGSLVKWIIIVVSLLSVLSLFGLRAIDGLPMTLAQVWYEISTSSIFVFLYVALGFLVLDLLRLVRVVPASWLTSNGTVAGIFAAVVAVVFVAGNVHYHHKYRQPLTIESHDKVSRPLRVVMLSDIHVGYHNRRAELGRWVDMVNREKPDLVLIAGDIVDCSVRPLMEDDDAAEFRRIQTPVYACLGNHEYFSGERKCADFYHQAGIRLLRDERVEVGDLVIVGRDDRTNTRRKPLKELLKGVDRNKLIINLDHEPYHLEEAEQCGVDFQLSGHTHYGQVWPISWITDAIYECAFGAYRKGRTQYYITSGMGIWGGKFRIGTRSEYVVADIR